MTGLPRLPETTFPTCRAHYPGGSSGCACRLLPRSCSLPQMAGGSASALSLSRPAQASHTLRPAGSLSRLKRPLSRGSSTSSYPDEPLVSYQINRQLSGWNLPPQVIRAFGAHCQKLTYAPQQRIGFYFKLRKSYNTRIHQYGQTSAVCKLPVGCQASGSQQYETLRRISSSNVTGNLSSNPNNSVGTVCPDYVATNRHPCE